MTVIHEVEIKIESVIDNLDHAGLPEGESERTVSSAGGFYKYSDGDATLTYSENGESGSVSSEISVTDGVVIVKRSGAIESEMRFCEGELHRSIYCIPPYKFDAAVKAKRVRISLDRDGGSIDLVYNMRIGGQEKAARMKIWISRALKTI